MIFEYIFLIIRISEINQCQEDLILNDKKIRIDDLKYGESYNFLVFNSQNVLLFDLRYPHFPVSEFPLNINFKGIEIKDIEYIGNELNVKKCYGGLDITYKDSAHLLFEIDINNQIEIKDDKIESDFNNIKEEIENNSYPYKNNYEEIEKIQKRNRFNSEMDISDELSYNSVKNNMNKKEKNNNKKFNLNSPSFSEKDNESESVFSYKNENENTNKKEDKKKIKISSGVQKERIKKSDFFIKFCETNLIKTYKDVHDMAGLIYETNQINFFELNNLNLENIKSEFWQKNEKLHNLFFQKNKKQNKFYINFTMDLFSGINCYIHKIINTNNFSVANDKIEDFTRIKKLFIDSDYKNTKIPNNFCDPKILFNENKKKSKFFNKKS